MILIREYLTDTAANNILTLLQRNDGLTPAEAEAKIRREIKKSEDDYKVAAREVLNHPVLGKNKAIRKLVLNIPYGMGGNVSHKIRRGLEYTLTRQFFLSFQAWWSLVVSPHIRIRARCSLSIG